MPSLVGDRGPVLQVLGWALTRMRNISLVLPTVDKKAAEELCGSNWSTCIISSTTTDTR